MLRITETADGPGTLLRLEGKLTGPWVEELGRACEAQAGRPAGVSLDLSAVTFVDPSGVNLLRELTALGVSVRAASRFVAELLRREGRR
jgi:ABC-type transporter Mla MlaB component